MSTVREIEKAQAEYDALEREGQERFSPKATALLEKKIRDEVKKRMNEHGEAREDFKKRKGAVAARLRELKATRRDEIVAAVTAGEIAADVAEREIMDLGWPIGVARELVRGATTGGGANVGQPLAVVETKVELAPEKNAEPEPIEEAQQIETLAQLAAEPAADAAPAAEGGGDAGSAGEHQEILDPVGAEEPVSREVVYRETGRNDQPPSKKSKKK